MRQKGDAHGYDAGKKTPGRKRHLIVDTLGRSRGGLSCKIHILCDAKSWPLHAHLTPGQAHETSAFDALMSGADAQLFDAEGEPLAWPSACAGDKSYRAKWIDDYLLSSDIQSVVPSQSNKDRKAYHACNIVERLIGWLRECRRIFSRFEKTAKNFLGMIRMAFGRSSGCRLLKSINDWQPK